MSADVPFFLDGPDWLPPLLRQGWEAYQWHLEGLEAEAPAPAAAWHRHSPERAARVAAGWVPRDLTLQPALPRYLMTTEELARPETHATSRHVEAA
ncbi:hypothetical protein CLV35_1276 [Motilibacter peucedani]|uniref:Uncharacterized protein n=1 Tax=Motilibacter peucedani TaxID=598650 RepID=A0A420XRQ7_9ACTN|nr:hypothetical protein [Motilibacter peucedani]RKS77583.1 hypothetical protein CLV35_1276 [Motilibacter peucedani]